MAMPMLKTQRREVSMVRLVAAATEGWNRCRVCSKVDEGNDSTLAATWREETRQYMPR